MVARIGWPAELTVDGVTDAAILTEALNVAVDVVWALSGRRFGQRAITIRPSNSADRTVWPDDPFAYLGDDPAIVATPSLCRTHGTAHRGRAVCGCTALTEIALPRRPVTAVTKVTIDGTTIDPAAYRLEAPRWLVRLDGEAWPACQDLTATLGDPDTFGVTFRWGRAVPASGALAARRLATEIAKNLADEDCDLPARVTSITRGGVSMALIDPQDFLEHGRTGLYEVDLFLASYNPHGKTSRSRVVRADDSPTGRKA